MRRLLSDQARAFDVLAGPQKRDAVHAVFAQPKVTAAEISQPRLRARLCELPA